MTLSLLWDNLMGQVGGSFNGALAKNSTKRWGQRLFCDETRGFADDSIIELPFTQQETRSSESPQFGQEFYEVLIAGLQHQSITDLEARHLIGVLVAEFPTEGIPELVETMRDMQDFYMQKRNDAPQPSIRIERKSIVVTGTHTRPSFLTLSEE